MPQTIPRLPDDWWVRTPLLARIRCYALDVPTHPDAVYVALLCNVATHIPPGVLTAVGSEPNLWAGIIGGPGRGKNMSMYAADDILSAPRQILAFCPVANIGVVASQDDPEGLDSGDLRWIVIPAVDGHMEVRYGDYLVCDADGEVRVWSPAFEDEYEEVAGD